MFLKIHSVFTYTRSMWQYILHFQVCFEIQLMFFFKWCLIQFWNHQSFTTYFLFFYSKRCMTKTLNWKIEDLNNYIFKNRNFPKTSFFIHNSTVTINVENILSYHFSYKYNFVIKSVRAKYQLSDAANIFCIQIWPKWDYFAWIFFFFIIN